MNSSFQNCLCFATMLPGPYFLGPRPLLPIDKISLKKRKYEIFFHFRCLLSDRLVEWKGFELFYNLNGLFKIPCRFNLRKYPFTTQECVITFAIANANDEKFVKYQKIAKNGDIDLPGRIKLGEYEVIRCFVEEFDSNHSVAVHFQLSPFYSYHLLNSFFTSLLILLISFATFFFQRLR